jgi:hypothetical protein
MKQEFRLQSTFVLENESPQVETTPRISFARTFKFFFFLFIRKLKNLRNIFTLHFPLSEMPPLDIDT